MASISASGIASAGRTGGWARSILSILLAAPLTAASPAVGPLDIRFEGLRSGKGMILACLTRDPRYFPHCDRDPHSYHAAIRADGGGVMRFNDIKPGDYALTVLHDENANSKADMTLGIPREGVGFSRNPRLTFGAPSFSAARITVAGPMEETIRLKYFL